MEVELGLGEVLDWLSKMRPRTVLIQGPLGLRKMVEAVAENIQKLGVQVFISSSPTWGGCDIAVEEAKRLGAQAIIHLGHAPFLSNTEIPVLYLEARYKDYGPLRDLIQSVAEKLEGFKKVGLGMSVQWLNHLDRFAEDLRGAGFEVYVGDARGHLFYRGQVLGCDYTSLKSVEDRVECFLVVGSIFHALGIALTSSRPTLAADPHTGRVEWLDSRAKRILSTRYNMIETARKGHRVGIIVSRKPGQMLMGLANKLKTMLEDAGYRVQLLVTDEVAEEEFTDFSFDFYINTACPRLSIEDQARFRKPMLLPSETLVMLGMVSWEELVSEGLLLALNPEQTIARLKRNNHKSASFNPP